MFFIFIATSYFNLRIFLNRLKVNNINQKIMT